MFKKKKILRIISSLDPKSGGPAIAIVDSTKLLNSLGFSIDILTHDSKNSNYAKIKDTSIINIGPSIGNYKINFKIILWLIKNHKKYDLFIIHGLWQINTLLAYFLLKKRYHVFTHGQLDPFFSKNKLKMLKKVIYWYLFERRNLLNAKSLLLTSELEKKSLSKTFVNTAKIKKKVTNYGVLKPNINLKNSKIKFLNKFKKFKNKNFFIFIGRFHEKKGCEIIIELVKYFKMSNKPIKILMCGPESPYKDYLKDLSKKYFLNDYIHWAGFLYKDLKWGALSSAKAMLLPSHGENFGVSVTESLLCGTPVITTNKVNIHKYISKHNAGFISNSRHTDFIKSVDKFNKLDRHQIHNLSLNAKKCFDMNFNLKKQIHVLAKHLND
tara:strand:- start:7199 stop:8344 length:1146 start_codon:yes stop_codon:yes gene_type:complete